AEAVAGYAQARARIRQARLWARVDEVSVEFTAEDARLYRGAVQAALACQDLDSAYAALCDGKASLFSELRQRASRRDEPESVTMARKELTDWLRLCAPHRPEASRRFSDSESEKYQQALEAFVAERDD